jgi:hypothetical protein
MATSRSAISTSLSFSASTLHFNASALYFLQRFQIAETEMGQAVLLFDHDPAGLLIFEQIQQFGLLSFTPQAISLIT